MIRTCLTDPSATAPRVEEIRGIVERFDEFPNSLAIPMSEHDVEDGYTRWAPTYDGRRYRRVPGCRHHPGHPLRGEPHPPGRRLRGRLPGGGALDPRLHRAPRR